jgi:hypothetical protein
VLMMGDALRVAVTVIPGSETVESRVGCVWA